MYDFNNNIIILIFVILFGLCIGSFITLVSYRLPKGENIVSKRSKCPKCNHVLGVLDLFPVFSWLFNMGKCRYCKSKISFRYIAIEIVTAALITFLYIKFAITPQSICLLLLLICLIIMSVIDFEYKIIPDILQIIMLFLGILYSSLFMLEPINMLYGFLLGLGMAMSLRYGFYLVKKKEGLGMGDVKFFAVAGIWIGVLPFFVFLFLSGICGIFIAMIWKILGKGEQFPFGPALAISLFICLIYPYEVMNLFYIV